MRAFVLWRVADGRLVDTLGAWRTGLAGYHAAPVELRRPGPSPLLERLQRHVQVEMLALTAAVRRASAVNNL
jgi:hypothetical protein